MINSVFFIIVLLLPIYNYAKWEEVDSPKGKIYISDIFKTKNTLITNNSYSLFLKNDKDINWKKINPTGLDSLIYFYNFKVNNDNVFLKGESNSLNNNGIYQSKDLGFSFEKIYSDKINKPVQDFEIYNDTLLILIGRDIYKYDISNSIVFDSIKIETPYGFNKIKLIDDIIVVYDKGAISGNPPPPIYNDGILFSEDLGKSWKEWNKGLERNYALYNSFYFSKNISLIGTNKGLYKSNGLEEKWEYITIPSVSKDITNVLIDADKFYISTKLGEIYISSNQGQSWELLHFLDKNESITSIKNIEGKIYFTSSFGVFEIKNNNIESLNLEGNPNYFNFKSQNNTNYMIMENNGIHFFDKISKTWKVLNDTLSTNGHEISGFDIKDSLIIAYHYNNNNLKISRDLGKNWIDTIITYKVNGFGQIYIFEDIIILTSGKMLFYSTDKAKTWINFNESNPEFNINFRNVYKYNQTTFIATTENDGILISIDKCKTWNKISNSDENAINEEQTKFISIYNNQIISPKIVYAQIDQFNYDYMSDSLFYSKDLGETWDIKKFHDEKAYIFKMINYNENIFIISNNGFHYSKDFGITWDMYNEGIDMTKISIHISQPVRDIDLVEGFLYMTLNDELLQLPLSELGIEYTSVTERIPFNYLFSYPPYPHPSNNQINVKVAFDNQLIFNKDNIEIYSIFGSKAHIDGNVNLIREDDYHALVTWDVSNINPGIYIMQVTYGNEKLIWKIIVTD